MMFVLDKDFNAGVRAIRKKKGLTQTELAWRAGVSKKTIQKFEYNNRNSRIESVMKICKALGIELKWGVVK